MAFTPSPHNATVTIVDHRQGIVEGEPRRRRVAIMGATPSRLEAPLDDDEWEVWCCNRVFQRDSQKRLRADRWFELHPMNVQDETDWQWIRQCPFPMYLIEEAEGCQFPVRYPIEEVCESAGFRPYFSCTFAYQIALAIYEGFAEIGLFGVDLDIGSTRERTVERACVTFWAGIAHGRGIKLTFPKNSTLTRHPLLYGYQYDDEKAFVEELMELHYRRHLAERKRAS